MTSWNFSSDYIKSQKFEKVPKIGSLNDIYIGNCLWLFCAARMHTTVEFTMKNDWLSMPQIEHVIQDENFVSLVVVTLRLLTIVKIELTLISQCDLLYSFS